MNIIQTFTIKKINIIVEYNTNLYSKQEILKCLKDGAKSKDKFDEYTSEFEIKNYDQVIIKLFPPKKVITKVLNLTEYMKMVTLTGRPLKDLLLHTFDIVIVKDLGNNVYELSGPKRGFIDLNDILSL